jgi:hypothetical protein
MIATALFAGMFWEFAPARFTGLEDNLRLALLSTSVVPNSHDTEVSAPQFELGKIAGREEWLASLESHHHLSFSPTISRSERFQVGKGGLPPLKLRKYSTSEKAFR